MTFFEISALKFIDSRLVLIVEYDFSQLTSPVQPS
jgi:hypothetical protein